ncbi:hypothetical protein [Lysobacter panacisoli]|uniref:Uncharacterized protein n=1 Tax=Lysobacter panacisoli TaxID=1255263 RepID=A0ABP9LC67_9GAMM|nr:hypothetical protein [Lysobacter panacisoli]
MAVVDCQIKFGIATTASPTAWAGGGGRRNVSDWLPRIDEPLAEVRNGKIYILPRWYKLMGAFADRLGGINGPSIPQVQGVITSTQVQLADTTNYAIAVSDFASQIATTAATTAEVAQTASLPGSGTIPEPGEPPPRPGSHAL